MWYAYDPGVLSWTQIEARLCGQGSKYPLVELRIELMPIPALLRFINGC
jgi:hypothetical protein